MVWIWLGIIIALVLLELSTINLVMGWYAIGAVISLILSVFFDNFFIQFLIFIIVGSILLFTMRDYSLKIVNDKKIKELIKEKLHKERSIKKSRR